MARIPVLILGATGETGMSIVDGLAKDGLYDISILVRPSSASKPAVLALSARGFPIVQANMEHEINPNLLRPYEVVISAIGPEAQLAQFHLATAAAAAGVKRFIPCAFITICPPGGVMSIRDEKEQVFNHVLKLKLPFTIIDTGFWHQLSFPRVPSGRVDGALVITGNKVYGDGEAGNLLTDLRDIGVWVARIAKDPRTLNKKVVVWSDELSQHEIWSQAEEVSGEKIERNAVSEEEVLKGIEEAKVALAKDPENIGLRMGVWSQEYLPSKYWRRDNTLENAKYLGYLDGRELYPDMKPITFKDFFRETLEAKVKRPYEGKW